MIEIYQKQNKKIVINSYHDMLSSAKINANALKVMEETVYIVYKCILLSEGKKYNKTK